MKKVVSIEKYGPKKGEKRISGFKEEINWKKTSWYRGPKKEGNIIVSNGNGRTYDAWCTGDTTGARLFDGIVGNEFGEARFSDSGEELSSDDLIALYKQFHVWYKLDETCTDSGAITDLTILRGDDIPKYFVDPYITGPIDSEIDTYEETEYDLYL